MEKTTGVFKDRGNLETVVIYLRGVKQLPFHVIARKCGVSRSVVEKIYYNLGKTQ